ELSTVTMSRSLMPKRRLSGSVVSNSVLVKKLTVSALSEGTARISRNSAISAIAATMIAPDAVAMERNIVSARPLCGAVPTPAAWSVLGSFGICAVSPAGSGPVDSDRSDPVTSGCTVIVASADRVDRGGQPGLERLGDRDVPVVLETGLAVGHRRGQERLDGLAGGGVGVLRADDLVGGHHHRVGARLRRAVERAGVEHQVVALADDLHPVDGLA